MKEKILWIRNKTALKSVVEVLQALPVDGSVEIAIRKYNPDHSDAQRALAWILLGQIAQNIPDKNGELHAAEWWHATLMIHFGYIAGTIQVKLKDVGWVDIPDRKSLSPGAKAQYRMSKEEVGDYITQLEQFMAERGVIPERVA